MLNTAQKQAVNCDAKKILCLAGAGTGKTHSVISRISRLINDGADNNAVQKYLMINLMEKLL